ncbi:hypothetical protein Hanom_Chr10g00961991 [Helianthus anomalus]
MIDLPVYEVDHLTITIDIKGSKYPLHCIGRSIHGTVKDLKTLNNLNQILRNNGLENYGLSYVGGLSVLLTLGDPGRVSDIMSNHAYCLSNIFSRFHVWNGEDLPMDRVVSLRITGESSFSWEESENTDSSVVVLVPLGRRIEESVVLNWRERRFVVWVTEDVGVWKPELDEEKSMNDNELESDDDEEEKMEDDMEEGEIRRDESPVDGRSPQGTEESKEDQKSANDVHTNNFNSLHGDMEQPSLNPRCEFQEDNARGEEMVNDGLPRNNDVLVNVVAADPGP